MTTIQTNAAPVLLYPLRTAAGLPVRHCTADVKHYDITYSKAQAIYSRLQENRIAI
jgi:hypothetical protein